MTRRHETTTWRAARGDDRLAAHVWAAAAIASLLIAPLVPSLARWAPECTFRAWTGLACPTCGTTRVAVALAHADVLGALATNPLATVVGALFFVGGLAAPLWVWSVGRIPEPRGLRARTVALGSLALLILNWVYLIARGT